MKGQQDAEFRKKKGRLKNLIDRLANNTAFQRALQERKTEKPAEKQLKDLKKGSTITLSGGISGLAFLTDKLVAVSYDQIIQFFGVIENSMHPKNGGLQAKQGGKFLCNKKVSDIATVPEACYLLMAMPDPYIRMFKSFGPNKSKRDKVLFHEKLEFNELEDKCNTLTCSDQGIIYAASEYCVKRAGYQSMSHRTAFKEDIIGTPKKIRKIAWRHGHDQFAVITKNLGSQFILYNTLKKSAVVKEEMKFNFGDPKEEQNTIFKDFEALAFSPDGKYVALSYSKLYCPEIDDVEQCVQVEPSYHCSVFKINDQEKNLEEAVADFSDKPTISKKVLAFSPDGGKLLTGSSDGSIQIYDLIYE